MMRALLAIFLFCGAVGCAPIRPVEHFPYTCEGIPKPRLGLIQLIDSSGCYVPWCIDQELTNTLRYQLMSNGRLYILPEEQVNAPASGMQGLDFFSPDLTFAKEFCQADYLVAVELIEHEVVPFVREKVSPCFPSQTLRCSSMLQMKLRLRVVDLTCESPKVILQEVFTSNSMVPKEAECLDYERLRWGTPAFQSTPMGQAHRRLICDLADRIESVIQGI